ncbi:flagella basal body P-ring formation protein FlgA [Gammaproteobacteria bacterium 42_54_T18]|nr:flagella basal body P-ring formation protein FlgA [Gammaproteobacteria bacterium 42_54_T18]
MPPSANSEENATAKTQILSAVTSFSKKLIENQRYSRIDTTLPHLDPRLRLAICNTPLNVKPTSTRRKLGRLTLKISCFDKKSWSLHVPLELKAYENVVVAAQPILRGQIITAGNLTKDEREVTRLNQGYFAQPKLVVGSIAKRSIATHRVILPRSLSTPKLVNKGESISIQAISSGLSIKAMGIALVDGSLGDLIQVKNSKTQRIVEGRISAPGQIVINL